MTNPTLTKIKNVRERLRIKKPWDSIIIFALNILISIPLFLIIHQNIIDPEWPFHLDRILIFAVMVTVLQLILHRVRTVLILFIGLYLLVLAYGSLFGNYGFSTVFDNYQAMIYTMSEDPHPQDVILSKLLPFPNKGEILDAIDYNNPKVRNFAVGAATKYFKEFKSQDKERRMIQCFSVFKEIRNEWNYVNDPAGREYIAHASESLQHFSGDCDDHAILMAACIRAIGGTPRLIHTGGHLYPEMLIGTRVDLERANYLIKQKLFVNESKNQTINYHVDEHGQIWLNLDYTARYPGGPFMSEEILGALTLN
ncbi:transglutaminase [Flavobacterium akiainvivens]|uniref:Transglutaminase n=1 Tax=Flavobacterium akiainvivens TaxID=1202724 RepID=A0A0M8M9B6_9FLAO|nr:transglutaminase domain-containing protein [Flavobacterium akiainvivens]KOS05215.1 transglutaminase [Flavobacterium akiainvivens]SFQ50571.1 Transglutaminase-like superfamily protein [Flavobacterium akiainvivens]